MLCLNQDRVRACPGICLYWMGIWIRSAKVDAVHSMAFLEKLGIGGAFGIGNLSLSN
jgi:hypothetical protein